MQKVRGRLARFWRGGRGSQTVEYALILLLVSLMLFTVLKKLGGHLEKKFDEIVTKVDKA